MVELGFPRRIFYNEPVQDALGTILDIVKPKNVAVISDKVLVSQPFYKNVVETLKNQGLKVDEYHNVKPEPDMELAYEASRVVIGKDLVIAIGGGSVIDVAKAAVALAKKPDLKVENIAPFNPLGIEFNPPYLVVIPTTAGTGSDGSYGIVLSREEGGVKVKIAVGSYELVPHYTILDPSIPQSAPLKVKLGALVDALSHAVEALVSTNSNPLSDALARESIIIIMTESEKAIKKGDHESWSRIQLAATMAGIAFTNSGLGLAHAIAHPLGAILGTHHGTTVGIVLPAVVELYENDNYARKKLETIKIILENIYGLQTRKTFREHIITLYEKIGFPTSFSEIGISPDKCNMAIEQTMEHYMHDPDIAFSPVIPEPEKLLDKLREANICVPPLTK